MKEAIGNSFITIIVITFMSVLILILASSSSYSKAAKVRNRIIEMIENNQGYNNLMKLVSAGFTDGFYVKPRIDTELLRKHHEGLICLSACLAGEIPQKLLRGDYKGAKDKALELQGIFGKDNFYIEIQNHGIREQLEVLPQLSG